MRDEITYKEVESVRGAWRIKVYDDDVYVGDIRLVGGGFAYFPRNSKLRGATFRTVREVQASLESSDE